MQKPTDISQLNASSHNGHTSRTKCDEDSIFTMFTCQQKAHAGKKSAETWRAELCCYLDEMEEGVDSPDIDVVKWWQVHRKMTFYSLLCLLESQLEDNAHCYPQIPCLALDILTALASSVSCEWLFSVEKQTANYWHSCLGLDKFEQLQVMKFLWCLKIINYASINSVAVLEEVDFSEFEDLFSHDVVEAGLDSSWINKKGPFAF